MQIMELILFLVLFVIVCVLSVLFCFVLFIDVWHNHPKKRKR